MINARMETVVSKPALSSALKQRRYLIPANGFYEWKGKSGEKEPYYFSLPSMKPFAFASLWEDWEDKNAPSTEPYRSCTIITTSASESVSDVHDRMPLILKSDAYSRWLNADYNEPDFILDILKQGAVADLRRYPVSKLVNRVSNNREECMKPLDELSGRLGGVMAPFRLILPVMGRDGALALNAAFLFIAACSVRILGVETKGMRLEESSRGAS